MADPRNVTAEQAAADIPTPDTDCISYGFDPSTKEMWTKDDAGTVRAVGVSIPSGASFPTSGYSSGDYYFNTTLGVLGCHNGGTAGDDTDWDYVSLTDLGGVSTTDFNDHSARHENGGSDELSLDASQIATGALAVARGGTNTTSLTGSRVLKSASDGLSIEPLTGSGFLKLASGAPSVAALTAGDITSGELSVARGGTGASSLPNLSKRLYTATGVTASPGWAMVPLDTSETGYANTGWTGSPDYKWTPSVAGFYLITWLVVWDDTNMSAGKTLIAAIRKNGTLAGMSRGVVGTVTFYGFSGAKILYMNGSTDYVQLAAYQGYSDPEYRGGEGYTYLNGMLLAGDDNI